MNVKSLLPIFAIMFVSFLPVTAHAANSPSKFDVIGLHIGMPLNDATTLLKNRNPPMQIREGRGDIAGIHGSRIRGLLYVTGIAATSAVDNINLGSYAPPNVPSVSRISRINNFGKQPILQSTLRKSLIEKYGKPSYEGIADITGKKNGYYMYWSFKPNGSLLTKKSSIHSCVMFTKGLPIDKKGQKQCGVILYVMMNAAYGGTKDQPLVGSYSIELSDINRKYKMDQKTVDYTIVEAKKLENKSIQKATDAKKPQL